MSDEHLKPFKIHLKDSVQTEWLDIVILPEDISAHFLSILQRVLCDDGEVGHKHKTGCKLVEPSPEYLHHDPLCGHNGCLHQGMPGFEKYIPKCPVKGIHTSHENVRYNEATVSQHRFIKTNDMHEQCFNRCLVTVLLIAYSTVV